MNPMVELVGYLAGFLTTISYFPQVIKTLKFKETKDIALGMYILLTTGVGLWFAYGVLLGSWPVIIANGVSFGLAASILAMKLRYG